MPYADVGAERLYYEIQGEGPPLVLIRGLSRSMRFWEPLLPHLAGRFQLFLFDHRGIGRSEVHDTRFGVKEMAADLAGLLEAVDFPRAHVFGISLGGMVAQRLAIDHPERVDKLILCATTAGGRKSRFPRIDTLLKLAVYSALFPVDMSVKLQGPLLISPQAHKTNPQTAQSWAPFLSREPLDGKVVLSQALGGARHSAWRQLADIQAKTLVLHGDADRLISVKNGYVLRDGIPDAELVLFPGCGHDLVAEQPAEVGRHIRSFFLDGSAAEVSAASRSAA
jgi:3-oxoadipate enol-lactonase